MKQLLLIFSLQSSGLVLHHHTDAKPRGFLSNCKIKKSVIPTQIRKVPVKAVFDSGASMTVIDRSLADKLKIKSDHKGFVSTLAATKYTEFASNIPFNFYGAEIQQDVAIGDLSDLGVDVMFGAQLLLGAVMEFDFPHERMRFHRLGGFRYEGPTKAIPLTRHDMRYFVDLTINGKEEQFLVDTGAEGAIALPVEAKVVQAKLAAGSKAVTLSGAHQETTQSAEEKAKAFTFGSYEIKDAVVSYYDPKQGDTRGGILGMGLLKEFNVIIDTDHKAMYIESYE